LVPTDFSEHADKALKLALDVAGSSKGRVYLLHVIDESIQQCGVDYCLSGDVVRDIESSLERTAESLLREKALKFSGSGDVEIVPVVKKGSSADVILDEQKEVKADLIVLGSQGRSRLYHPLGGSVGERVMRGAACPVLVAGG